MDYNQKQKAKCLRGESVLTSLLAVFQLELAWQVEGVSWAGEEAGGAQGCCEGSLAAFFGAGGGVAGGGLGTAEGELSAGPNGSDGCPSASEELWVSVSQHSAPCHFVQVALVILERRCSNRRKPRERGSHPGCPRRVHARALGVARASTG